MTPSSHLALREAVAAVFRVEPRLAGGRIDEQQQRTLSSGVASSISVIRDESRAQSATICGAPIDWTTTLRIVVKARATPIYTAEQVADDIVMQAYARLLADTSLGGIADDVEAQGIEWQQDEVDSAVAMAVLTLIVQHRTNANTLS